MSRPTEQATSGEMNAAISSEIVHLLREHTGRGPTKARTTGADNLIVCVVEDALTVGERSLVRGGEAELVLDTRRAFQRTMKAAYVEAVERISGREVAAFMSDSHIDPDSGVEIFLLAPLN
jgi:uncharacterized protein YbcI